MCDHTGSWTPVGRLDRGKVNFHYVCDECGCIVRQIAVYAYRTRPRPRRAFGTLGALVGYVSLIRKAVRRGWLR